MRKSIILKVKIKVEGDVPPPDDFEQIAMQALKDILAAGSASRPQLKVTLKQSGEAPHDDTDTAEDAPAAPGK